MSSLANFDGGLDSFAVGKGKSMSGNEEKREGFDAYKRRPSPNGLRSSISFTNSRPKSSSRSSLVTMTSSTASKPRSYTSLSMSERLRLV